MDDLDESQETLRTMTMRAIESEMDAVNELHTEQIDNLSNDSLDGMTIKSAPATAGNSPIPPPPGSTPSITTVSTLPRDQRKQSLLTREQSQKETDQKTLQLLSSLHRELSKKDIQISQLKNCLNQMQPRLSSYGQV